jgi:hypothetical protein
LNTKPAEHRAERQHDQRDSIDPRAFVRVIAAGAVVRDAHRLVPDHVSVAMGVVNRVLDMLAPAQRGLPKKVRNISRHE